MSFSYPAEQWVEAFAITLWIEVPVYLIVLRRTELSFPIAFSMAMGVNIFTHPALWYLFPKWYEFPEPFHTFYPWLLIAESCVSLTEGLLLGLATKRMRWSILVAFGVNALSTLTGLVR